MFRAIIADDFPPFGKFALELPPVADKPKELAEVHLFTGVNGTGKTRLLCLIAAMLDNPSPLLKRMKGIASQSRVGVADKESSPPPHWESHGALFADKDDRSPWLFFQLEQGSFRPQSAGRPIVNWVRSVPAFAYRSSPYVSDSEIKTMHAVPSLNRVEYLSFDRGAEASQALLQRISDLLIQAALEVRNAQSPGETGRADKLLHTLELAIIQITGVNFRFDMQTHPSVSISVIWDDVKLCFDVLPDGLRSIIGWMVHALVMMDLWLQGKADPMETEAVFLLDEIENYLHPAWQKRILPAFQHLFPKAQIFVATHSPFVIGSMSHGWIHRLTMTPDGKVQVQKPVPARKGESYISVVEEIMGMPEWYNEETEELLKEFRLKRDKAYSGDSEAQKEARQLGTKIGERSMELDFMMGKELIQMDRQLAKKAGQK